MESREKPTILVVDDQIAIRVLSKRILEGAGFTVIMAEDGVEALKHLAEKPVDLIVADIAMPNLNGYQLFERVSKNPEWVNVPFILLSARDLDSDIRYGKSLGVDDYITKPFDPADLLSSVRGRLLRASQLASLISEPTANNGKNTLVPHDTEHNKTCPQPVLCIDTRRQLVKYLGCEIKLSAREYRLLLILYDNQHRVVPVEELIRLTHGYHTTRSQASSLLRPLVRSIRRKFGHQVGEYGCIRNVRGIGYQYIEFSKADLPDELSPTRDVR
jgi:DNA-binding response OmpR family regulator